MRKLAQSAAGLLPCSHQADIRLDDNKSVCKFSSGLMQVDCQDFLSIGLVQGGFSKSANIKLH